MGIFPPKQSAFKAIADHLLGNHLLGIFTQKPKRRLAFIAIADRLLGNRLLGNCLLGQLKPKRWLRLLGSFFNTALLIEKGGWRFDKSVV